MAELAMAPLVSERGPDQHGDSLPGRSTPRPWLRLYLMVAAPLYAVYIALPEPPRYLWAAIGLLSLVGLVVGIRVNRPRRQLPWWLASAGVAALMLGDTTYDVMASVLGEENPFPSAADAIYLAMYPLIAGGLLVLVRLTTPLGDKAAVIDAAIVTVAVGLLVWVYLVEPYVQDPTLTWLQKAVSIGYPLGDVMILAVLARLMIGGDRRPRSLWLLSIGTVGLLASDVVYGLGQLNGTWSTGGVLDLGWVLFYGAWGAAALSPDMTRLTDPVRPKSPTSSPRRLLFFTLIPLAVPGLQIWGISQGTADLPVTAAGSAVLFLLVSLRFTGLVHTASRAAHRETSMRRTGEALVAASDPDTVFHVALTAIGEITRPPTRLLVATGSPLRLVFDSAGDEESKDESLDQLLQRHEGELRRQQFVLTSAADCGPAFAAALGPEATVLLAAMIRDEQISGLLVISGPSVDRPESVDPICSLASQMVLALDSIELTEQVAERRSEAHYRSLFQNAADIILVVDRRLRLRYATPSATAVLGWDASESRDRPIDSMVAHGDAKAARNLLDRVLKRGVEAGVEPADEWRIPDAAGDIRQFEVSCRNLMDDPSLGGVVVTLHDITERRRLESDLQFQAYHDSLTQLPNRTMFLDRVERALSRTGRNEVELAVILIDLDDFKVINDTRGHAAGDALLSHVARRLQTVLRPLDSCARLGGDEFAILATGLKSEKEAREIAERLIRHLSVPFDIAGEVVTAGASVGVTTNTFGAHASELLLQADLAMYAAKDAGKGVAQLFRPELIDIMELRARTARELGRAIARDELVLHYQPVVALETGAVIGVEALLRWQHPERGLLMPSDFIAVVEESDLAVAVGEWVIDRAIAQAAEWQRSSPTGGGLRMNVNVTPREFAQPGFVSTVVSALERHDLPAGALVLEITERILAGRDPRISLAMTELHELGVRLAVDDFGTGYAALGYLRRFPVSTLKIDRSFVAGLGHSPDDEALVEAIIRLGETFGFDLVAEGVETEQQRTTLLRLGCGSAQGFLYSTALPPAEIETFIRTQSPVVVSGHTPRSIGVS
ncbi:EAL domain-containing protein [Nocardioides immobilis]|uniref:EAL domain-containing protein n=1 Tax=Nocardioides immobilis TaxID=2049295 RepID=A0A417XVS9_9ACTN|nr:bifunctional diguanylate cyclase/phosphodiesterase [Nocardioides immobilis]RHW24267.1 EAL domain-containing protein [Nocardioides immobilis]